MASEETGEGRFAVGAIVVCRRSVSCGVDEADELAGSPDVVGIVRSQTFSRGNGVDASSCSFRWNISCRGSAVARMNRTYADRDQDHASLLAVPQARLDVADATALIRRPLFFDRPVRVDPA